MAVTTELVLIRHGETDWNKEHRLQGQAKPGPPLNDLGIQQTEMLSHVITKRYESFDAVVSSDLLRTIQTAQILAAGYNLEVQHHPGLRERNIGALQGLTNLEAPILQPEAWAALQSGDHTTRIPGGGESLNDLKERLNATLLDIAAQFPGQRVLVISHGGALHATHRAARGFEAKGKVMNCSISVVTAELLEYPDPQQWQQIQQTSQTASECAAYSSSSASSQTADIPDLGLLFSSRASQGSMCCSDDCGGCCYCLGDCSLDDVDVRDWQGTDVEMTGQLDWDGVNAEFESLILRPVVGKLAMHVWNDTSALFDLEAEEGVGLTAAGFGGCAREA